MNKKIELFKALSDENRLLIIEMLSCGELCGCDIIKGLGLTQPTISHHMKILQQSGLVNAKKRGKWMIYKLNEEVFNQLSHFIKNLSSHKENCICKKIEKQKCDEENQHK